MKIGITGQSGFMGTHLFNRLQLEPELFHMVPFEDLYFQDQKRLNQWIGECDVIVHLAALNRHHDPDEIYRTNLKLVHQLIQGLEVTGTKPHVIFSSSTQEERDNPYGRSKKEGREMLAHWSGIAKVPFTGLIIPNVFGPFGDPYYNSVIATFSHQLTHQKIPTIEVDGLLKLLYISELTEVFRNCIVDLVINQEYRVHHTSEKKVSEILGLLTRFKESYFQKGIIPSMEDKFERDLFNTFRSYIDLEDHFPFSLQKHQDERGYFVEAMHLEMGGQVSFSTTRPGITRGNHFHTRKIERFVVVSGKALIQMRRVGTGEIVEFEVSGDHPCFIDMPVWYTHNIKNIGRGDLHTLFWISELFNPDDPDTFYYPI